MEVFTDYVCPWCYLGAARIERLTRNYIIDLRWVYFPLHPETPPEGTSLVQLFAGRNLDIEAVQSRLKGLMDAEGLPYGIRTHTYNSRLAQELGKWAETQPGSDGIHQALFRAYFVGGLNISRIDVLLDVVRSVNLPEGGRARSAGETDVQGSRGCRLGESPAVWGDGSADFRFRRLCRCRRAAL